MLISSVLPFVAAWAPGLAEVQLVRAAALSRFVFRIAGHDPVVVGAEPDAVPTQVERLGLHGLHVAVQEAHVADAGMAVFRTPLRAGLKHLHRRDPGRGSSMLEEAVRPV